MAKKKDPLVGLTVVAVRKMTGPELAREGWNDGRSAPVAIEFSDGSLAYASCDEEGNGPGALFTCSAKGKTGILV